MEPSIQARTVEEHRAEVLKLVHPLAPVTRPLLDCVGLTLAEHVTARIAVPPFTNSAMDGYAVRALDVAAATVGQPVELRVVGDAPAGVSDHQVLELGTAIRIMTGAPVPLGADAIVPVEMTDQQPGAGAPPATVQVYGAVGAGAYVRRRGEAVAVGDRVIEGGTVVAPATLAAAASVGYAELRVVPAPRVAVISTGDELAAPGAMPERGAVPDSNLVMLTALVASWGAKVTLAARVPDDHAQLRATLSEAAEAADLVLTSGGISAGAFEVVREALASEAMQFVQVAMQPGKPQGLGKLTHTMHSDVPLLALPGNPVSSFISFHAFVRPALDRLSGREHDKAADPHVQVRATEPWQSPAGRRQYVPVRLAGVREPYRATLTHRLGAASHLIGSLHRADALAIVPAPVTHVDAGDLLIAYPLRPLPH